MRRLLREKGDPGATGVLVAPPGRRMRARSSDYDFSSYYDFSSGDDVNATTSGAWNYLVFTG
ncbi:hypothetical protein ACF1GY_19500 [Streptomyces sp. NPDC014684]|uniref:hypothetical protein n=1 Tax=Streptomyces sp. NPDC014684 TaxID=3364880 RepID=UPI0036FD6578